MYLSGGGGGEGGTWRHNDVESTSVRRHYVASTSVLCQFDVLCVLGYVIEYVRFHYLFAFLIFTVVSLRDSPLAHVYTYMNMYMLSVSFGLLDQRCNLCAPLSFPYFVCL